MTVFAALEALDLSAGATEKDIRAAYRKLALVWHPDRFPPDSEVLKLAIAKMKQINHAFETLEAANFQTTTPAGGTNRGASQRDSGGQANDSGSKASDSEDRGVHDGKREIPPHAPSKAGSEDLTARASLATAKLALILGFLVFLGILSARVQFEFKSNSIGMELIELPVGKFLMGEGGGAVNVTLTKPFSLGKTEVTQGQWKSVMGSEPWKGQSEVKADKDCPATHVSWADAVAFCEKLTVIERKAGKLKANEEYRLPTEAEWEYACRAVTKTGFSFGDDESQLGNHGWYDGNTKSVGQGYAHKVGMKKSNPAGLFDMHGNVWEWCSDWYGGKLTGGIDTVGPERGAGRVLRGGSWWFHPGDCRSASRYGYSPSDRNNDMGFRVARSQSETKKTKPVEKSGESVTNSIGMELIGIPAGTFTMGSPADEKNRFEDEAQVGVTLTKSFELGKYEVTQGQWKSVMGSEPWKGQSEVKADKDCPATHVSWADAVAFCEKLTAIERKAGKLKANEEYRLPAEAEWEYACRAVTKTAFSFGDDLKQLDQYGWFDGNAKNVGRGFAHKVGLLKPNPWGLLDMHGNVSEWCSDWYGGKLSGGINPVGPEWDVNRVLRGGSWWSYPGFCRSAIRDYDVPSSRNGLLGFRVARSQSVQ